MIQQCPANVPFSDFPSCSHHRRPADSLQSVHLLAPVLSLQINRCTRSSGSADCGLSKSRDAICDLLSSPSLYQAPFHHRASGYGIDGRAVGGLCLGPDPSRAHAHVHARDNLGCMCRRRFCRQRVCSEGPGRGHGRDRDLGDHQDTYPVRRCRSYRQEVGVAVEVRVGLVTMRALSHLVQDRSGEAEVDIDRHSCRCGHHSRCC